MNKTVSHNPKYRRRWMVPRNIRRIYPWKIAQILKLFQGIATLEDWTGNQEAQNRLYKAFEDLGYKRKGHQYDSHSGGPRTYLRQLECLGLLYIKDRRIHFTQVGQAILDGKAPLPLLQRQLLRHQYPSTYGRKIKIHPALRVKPFLFILELLHQKGIKHLSQKELAIALLYGHSRSCIPSCVRKIKAMRRGASLEDVIDNFEEDVYTPRKQRFPDGLFDDANTFKNYLQVCCLILTEKRDGETIICMDGEAEDIYQTWLREAGHFIPTGNEEQFQRRYGALTKRGDTRTSRQPASQLPVDEQIILAHFFQLCGTNPISEIPADFVHNLHKAYGFPKDTIIKAIQPYLATSIDYFESTYIELSRSGKSSDAPLFEKATEAIFRDQFSFKTKHTGNLRRRSGSGGFADILLMTDSHCAIVDTKATPCYALPHSDVAKMTSTYIKNYTELLDGAKMSLEFATYVAGGFGKIRAKLEEIESTTHIPCSAISARQLLKVAKEKSQDDCRKMLSQSKIYE